MHDNDQAMREFAAPLPLAEFDHTAFTQPPALRQARGAIMTSACRSGAPVRGVTERASPGVT